MKEEPKYDAVKTALIEKLQHIIDLINKDSIEAIQEINDLYIDAVDDGNPWGNRMAYLKLGPSRLYPGSTNPWHMQSFGRAVSELMWALLNEQQQKPSNAPDKPYLKEKVINEAELKWIGNWLVVKDGFEYHWDGGDRNIFTVWYKNKEYFLGYASTREECERLALDNLERPSSELPNSL